MIIIGRLENWVLNFKLYVNGHECLLNRIYMSDIRISINEMPSLYCKLSYCAVIIIII